MKSYFSCLNNELGSNSSSRDGLSVDSTDKYRQIRSCWSPVRRCLTTPHSLKSLSACNHLQNGDVHLLLQSKRICRSEPIILAESQRSSYSQHHSPFLICNQLQRRVQRRHSRCTRIAGSSRLEGSPFVNVLRRRALSRHFSNSFASSLDVSLDSSQCSSNVTSSPMPGSGTKMSPCNSALMSCCLMDYSGPNSSSGYASRRSSLSGSPFPPFAKRGCNACWSDTSHASAVQPSAPCCQQSASRAEDSCHSQTDSFRSLYGVSGPPEAEGVDESSRDADVPNLAGHLYAMRFPRLKAQMEKRLEGLIFAMEMDLICESAAREGGEPQEARHRLNSDATARFAYNQILELARDCLRRCEGSAEGPGTSDDQNESQAPGTRLSAEYFNKLSDTLQRVLLDSRRKVCGGDSGLRIQLNDDEVDLMGSCCDLIVDRVNELFMITARSADVLECLESNPDEFYCALSTMESQLSVAAANVDSRGISHYLLAQLKTSISLNGQRTYAMLLERCKRLTACPERAVESPRVEDFAVHKRISSGAYGSVYLVQHKQSAKYMALKRLNKASICRKNFIQQVFTERDILSFVRNPFVVSLYCSFETDQDLCLVMEYVEGGDVRSLLDYLNGPMSVDMATLYFAEATLAVEYIHSCGIIHRDIKPSNLLITACGHIKLTDFGLSRIGLMDITSSQFQDNQVIGTPQYIAPEVILRTGYGQLVDWWSMGILLYEMLVGCTPFMSDDPDELFDLIVNADIEFPDYLDATDSKKLILALLSRNTSLRPHYIRDFAFFGSIDWEQLLLCKAEFVPSLSGPEDTSYFTHGTHNQTGESFLTTSNRTAEFVSSSTEETPSPHSLHHHYFDFGSCSPSFVSCTHSQASSDGCDKLEQAMTDLSTSGPPVDSFLRPQGIEPQLSPRGQGRTQEVLKTGERSKQRFRGSLSRARSFFIKHVLAGERRANSAGLELCLNRDSKLGFGFTFASFKASHHVEAVKNFLHRILFVCPGGPADIAGVRKNHRIMSVEDRDAASLTHSGLVKIVQKCIHCLHIVLSTSDRRRNALLSTAADKAAL